MGTASWLKFALHPSLKLGLIATLGLAFAADRQPYSIAYVSQGDLWVRGGANTTARRLTHSGASKSPRFSADGSFLAFLDNGAVTVVSVSSAEAIKLAVPAKGSGHFSWSPAENTLAVWGGSGVYLFSERHSWAVEQIVNADPPKSVVLDIVFNNDGQKLFVVNREAGTNGGADLGVLDLIDLQPPRRRSRLLTEAGSGLDLCGLSRDGKSLFFWMAPSFSSSIAADGLDLYAMSVAQRTARRLDTVQTLVHGDLLSFSPDGRSLLATSVGSGQGRETWAEQPIVEIPLSTGAVRTITPPNRSASFPAWSPSGDEIAYVQAPPGRGAVNQRRIWVVRRGGAEKRPVTTDAGYYRDEHPIWLSTETILFARIDGSSHHASLWTVSKDGAGLARVADLPALPDEALGFYGYVDWGEYFSVWVPYPAGTCRAH